MKENGEGKKIKIIKWEIFPKIPSLITDSLEAITDWVNKLPLSDEFKAKLLSIAKSSKEKD